MSRPPLPDDVQRFLLAAVPSVPFLEALLLLHAVRPRALSVAEVGRRLYLGDAAAARLLNALATAALAQAEGEGRRLYRLRPDDEALASLVDRLAHCHRTQLIDVTQLIHQRLAGRARTPRGKE